MKKLFFLLVMCWLLTKIESMNLKTVPNCNSPPAILLGSIARAARSSNARSLNCPTGIGNSSRFRILLKGGVAVDSTQAVMTIERPLPHGLAVLGMALRCGREQLSEAAHASVLVLRDSARGPPRRGGAVGR